MPQKNPTHGLGSKSGTRPTLFSFEFRLYCINYILVPACVQKRLMAYWFSRFPMHMVCLVGGLSSSSPFSVSLFNSSAFATRIYRSTRGFIYLVLLLTPLLRVPCVWYYALITWWDLISPCSPTNTSHSEYLRLILAPHGWEFLCIYVSVREPFRICTSSSRSYDSSYGCGIAFLLA
jgi:hypothetical protein